MLVLKIHTLLGTLIHLLISSIDKEICNLENSMTVSRTLKKKNQKNSAKEIHIFIWALDRAITTFSTLDNSND